jgi:1,4-dihydroxy-6-naphthoate synthase
VNLRIGLSPCPNDVFIFSGLLLGKTKPSWDSTFRFEDVETLNRLAQDGACDLLKISYANALNCQGYRLLRCGGALGRGCGPLLLTGGEAWDFEAEVLVPGEHTTANFLLDFWTNRPLQKRFVPFDKIYRELCSRPEAQGVVIHEMRFTFAGDGLRLVQDLGEHWEKTTGHPIPLGALAYREKPGMPSAEAVEQAVRDSLDWAWAHEAEALKLCAGHAQSMDPAVMRAHIDLYVNEFTRDLGEAGTAAVEFFLSRLRRTNS